MTTPGGELEPHQVSAEIWALKEKVKRIEGIIAAFQSADKVKNV